MKTIIIIHKLVNFSLIFKDYTQGPQLFPINLVFWKSGKTIYRENFKNPQIAFNEMPNSSFL